MEILWLALIAVTTFAVIVILAAIVLARWALFLPPRDTTVKLGDRARPLHQDSESPGTNDAPVEPGSRRKSARLLRLPVPAPRATLFILALAIALPPWITSVFLIHGAYWLRWKLLGIPMPFKREREAEAEDRFWTIIEADGTSIRDDPEQHLEAIRSRVRERRSSPFELSEFRTEFDRRMADACTTDLRIASLLICGRDSDEAFANFRAWLIARGESVYRDALLDADSLADVIVPYRDSCQLAGLRSVAQDVHRELKGKDLPPAKPPRAVPRRAGTPDFGDPEQVSRRLPRLAAMYLA